MEAVNLKLLNSSAVFPNGAFAYTQRGCCGGQPPNFFTSYPTGLQVQAQTCSAMTVSGMSQLHCILPQMINVLGVACLPL